MPSKTSVCRDGYNLGDSDSLVALLKWMRSCGFKSSIRMRPAYFRATERGLQVLENVREGSVIVSVPIECCVTRYYLSKCWLGTILKETFEVLSTQALMSAWLAVLTTPDGTEEIKKIASHHSDAWKHYLNSLPREYSLPLQFTQAEVDVLPRYLSTIVQKQKAALHRDYTAMLKYLPELSFERFVWGFCTVNTRAVYLQKDPRDPGKGEGGEDCLALVPFLDLLNHSDNVTVEAGINLDSAHSCTSGKYFYELKAGQPIKKYSEAFICYGRHSNTKLLTEYGFSLGIKSRSEHISIDTDDILKFLSDHPYKVLQVEEKLRILEENGLSSNLGLGRTGLNWTAKAVIFILLLSPSELRTWHVVYQHEDFPTIELIVSEFLSYFAEYLKDCTSKMADVGARSKYFHLAEDLVSSHVQIINQALKTSTMNVS